jgi:hypothetical protein
LEEEDVNDGKLAGSCLCGAIRFEFQGPIAAFRYCHCARCRKASGSAHAANLFVPAAGFSWVAGEERVSRYDLPGAKRFAVSFCSGCGTRVPHKVRDREDYLVPAGIVDTAIPVRPEMSIFWASRAGWYVEPGEMPRHDGYPA